MNLFCQAKITNILLVLKLWCVYHECKKTPLNVFIEISDGNKNAASRRLFPSKTTIEIACGMLQVEFATLCGNNAELFPQKKSIKLKLMITQLSELLNIYEKSKKRRQDILQKIYEITNSRNIEVAKKSLEKFQYQLQIEEQRLSKEKKQNEKSDATFEDFVVMIERNKFQIDRKNTSVATFAAYVKNFKRELAEQAKTNTNTKKSGFKK